VLVGNRNLAMRAKLQEAHEKPLIVGIGHCSGVCGHKGCTGKQGDAVFLTPDMSGRR